MIKYNPNSNSKILRFAVGSPWQKCIGHLVIKKLKKAIKAGEANILYFDTYYGKYKEVEILLVAKENQNVKDYLKQNYPEVLI